MESSARRLYSDELMDAFVRAQGGPWGERRQQLFKDASKYLGAGDWSDADYEAFDRIMNERSERHRASNERDKAKTGRVGRDETYKDGSLLKTRMRRHLGGLVQDLIGPAPKPFKATGNSELPAADTGRRVRGPSRYTPQQRERRIERAREKADKRKMPAEVSRKYPRSQLGAISEIIWHAGQALKRGVACILAIGTIAGAASVSERCVQEAIRRSKSLHHIEVIYRKDAPSEFRIIDPRILDRVADSGRFPYPSTSEIEKLSIETDSKGPLTGANLSTADKDEEREVEVAAGPEPEPVAVAPVQDEAEEVRQQEVEEAVAVLEQDGAERMNNSEPSAAPKEESFLDRIAREAKEAYLATLKVEPS